MKKLSLAIINSYLWKTKVLLLLAIMANTFVGCSAYQYGANSSANSGDSVYFIDDNTIKIY